MNRKAGVCKGNVTVIIRSVEETKSACCQGKWNRALEGWIYKAGYY